MPEQTKPLLLSTQQQIATYWPQIKPLLENAPVTEEYTIDNIYQLLISSQMFMFVVLKDTDVEFVMLIAATPSEQFPVVNIITVAGKNLRTQIKEYWEYFKGWCVMNGARAIDAYVPERIEKLLEPLGIKRETIHVRLRL